MNAAPFQPADLEELDEFLSRAGAVVTMGEVADGNRDANVIGMRHDVDNHIEPAVAMALWEEERGYHSTYFILHTAPYWRDKVKLHASLLAIRGLGHEVGFHVNAITEAIQTREDPIDIALDASDELRSYGCDVRGVVAHGDRACYDHGFINDEIFTESPRPEQGAPDRIVGGIRLEPVSRAELGFDYDPNWLPRGDYLSDSGGHWSKPFSEVTAAWPSAGQLHILQHPDWWNEAFAATSQAVA